MPFISMRARKVELTSDVFMVLCKVIRDKFKYTNKVINNLTLSKVYQVSHNEFEHIDQSLFVIIRTSGTSEFKYVRLSPKELEGKMDLSKLPLEKDNYYFMLDYRLYIKEEDTYYNNY